MLKANWPFLVIIAFLVYYFNSGRIPTPWPETLVWWAWVPYSAHIFLHNFVDGFQNTTRNIARIHLIETRGEDYDSRLVAPIQTALVPRFMLPVTFFWFAAHIGSFVVLLFLQGWGTAIVAEAVLILLGWALPIDYQGHLKRIQAHGAAGPAAVISALEAGGVSMDDIADRVDKAIRDKRNPQEWWASSLEKAARKKKSKGAKR
ncbi:MAG: hypothetical protein JEZ11_24020 [Desulfobacterales bacterium]|nr:hypothetical protein [Desulfobacterales bacterium]